MKLKKLKEDVASSLQDEVRKIFPEFNRKALFWVTIVGTGAGWLFMNTGPFGFGTRVYGGLLFAAGLIGSLVLFEAHE